MYVVPPVSSYVVDGDGYRIYTPDDIPSAPEILVIDVQKDVWSRGVDWWAAGHDWTAFPLQRSGGAFRGFDAFGGEKYATNDYTLRADAEGWRFVLPDYAHETQLIGNINSDNANGVMFDDVRLTTIAKPRIVGADALLTYRSISGSGLSPEQSAMLDELWKIAGLDSVSPMTVTQLERVAGTIRLAITGDGETTSTVTRQ